MTDKQKRAIIVIFSVFAIILSIVGVAMLIYGNIAKDQIAHIFGLVTSVISPSFIFGFVVKFITNKIHIKKIDKTMETHKQAIEEQLKQGGIKLSKIEKTSSKSIKITSKPYFELNGVVFYVTDTMIYIEFTPKNNDIETYKHLFSVIGTFQEQIRKDINSSYF